MATDLDQEYTNQFVDQFDRLNTLLGTLATYLQSRPTAALGGAAQDKRNWCSGLMTIPPLSDIVIPVDDANGEWVTMQYIAQGVNADCILLENSVARAYTATGISKTVTYRRNGANLVIRNLHATNSLIVIITLSDYESRPQSSS
jgi:hypothetical protein